MMCKQCASANQRACNGEVAVHLSGLEGLEKNIVWVFPKLVVCVHCGFTEFPVPHRELSVLVHGVPVEGAVILAEK